MTAAEYKTLRDAKNDMRLRIAQLIDQAGERGWETLAAFERAQYEADQAWRELGHDDRMAVLDEERVERDALLASLERRDAERAAVSA